MKKPLKPYFFFAEANKPIQKYNEEAINKLTESGISHFECIEELQETVCQLEQKLAALEAKLKD